MKWVKTFLLTLVVLLSVNFLGSANNNTPVKTNRANYESSIVEKDKQGKTYWINSKTKARHNKTCRWYGNTKSGYYTDKKIGNACGICGG